MNIYLHIGYNKTGTSLIQSFMCANNERLLAKGILFPQTDLKDNAHYALSKTFVGQPDSDAVSFGEKYIRKLYDEINAKLPKTMIFSSEYFVMANKYKIKAIKSFFRELFADSVVRIIVYLRRHDKWFESCFNQTVKTGTHPDWNLDIRDYILRIMGNPSQRSTKSDCQPN